MALEKITFMAILSKIHLLIQYFCKNLDLHNDLQ